MERSLSQDRKLDVAFGAIDKFDHPFNLVLLARTCRSLERGLFARDFKYRDCNMPQAKTVHSRLTVSSFTLQVTYILVLVYTL